MRVRLPILIPALIVIPAIVVAFFVTRPRPAPPLQGSGAEELRDVVENLSSSHNGICLVRRPEEHHLFTQDWTKFTNPDLVMDEVLKDFHYKVKVTHGSEISVQGKTLASNNTILIPEEMVAEFPAKDVHIAFLNDDCDSACQRLGPVFGHSITVMERPRLRMWEPCQRTVLGSKFNDDIEGTMDMWEAFARVTQGFGVSRWTASVHEPDFLGRRWIEVTAD